MTFIPYWVRPLSVHFHVLSELQLRRPKFWTVTLCMHARMCAWLRLYQCNVCGEGGEYESLVLDCPLFKHARIVLDKWEMVSQSPDSLAPVGLLHPVAFHLEPKGQPGTLHPHPEGHVGGHSLKFEGHQGALHSNTQGKSAALHPGSSHTSSSTTAAASTQSNPPASVLQHPEAATRSNPQTLADGTPANNVQALANSYSCALTADNTLSACSPVIEVPADFLPDASSVARQAVHKGQEGRASWSTDVQLSCGPEYVRAVCCPEQQSGIPASGAATAQALDAALQAVTQGAQIVLCLCASVP